MHQAAIKNKQSTVAHRKKNEQIIYNLIFRLENFGWGYVLAKDQKQEISLDFSHISTANMEASIMLDFKAYIYSYNYLMRVIRGKCKFENYPFGV